MKLIVCKHIKRAIVFLLGLFPLGIYTWQFRNSSISTDPADWASFGSYIGGIYSVLATILVFFLARSLAKRDKVIEKRKEVVEMIHQQILKINTDNVDERFINRLYRLLEDNKLYITDAIYEEVRALADYYLVVKSGGAVDFEKENSVKEHLRAIYNA